MSTKVIMPQMGESIVEGTITKWLKKIGDRVERDEPLFEISTDKVDSEIPAPASGIVGQILVTEGKTVKINTVVAIIEEGGEAGAKAEVREPAAEASAADARASDQTPAASPTGITDRAAVPPSPPAAREATVQPRDVRTSPLVRRMAREHNVDLGDIRGTGLEGRITKQDMTNYLEQLGASVVAQTPGPVSNQPAPVELPAPAKADDFAGAAQLDKRVPAQPSMSREVAGQKQAAPAFHGEAEVLPMTAMRKAIAEHMVLSKRTSAHVNTVFEVDMGAIVKLREKHMAEFERREGVKLTYTPFFVKALVDTVREFPVLNCSVSGENIVFKKAINVGIAVALETGLIVPVVKDAQLKSFTGIALACHDLAQRAKTKRLKPDDVQNGTISITNPGIYGSLFGTPIISQPQVAILGIGGIEKRPVVIDDAIAVRPMVYLSLTFDHRVIDGAVADQFMAALKKRLQSWSQWID